MKRRSQQLSQLCILIALTLMLVGRSAAQSPTASLAEYEALVRESHAAAQRHDQAGLRSASERLVAITRVQLSAEQSISVDNSWLREELQSGRPAMEDITARLGAMLEILVIAHEDDPEALQKLSEILSRPPFSPREKNGIERFLERVGDFLSELLRPIGRAVGFASLGQALLTLIAVVALGAGLFYMLRLLRGALVREARARPESQQEEEELPATSTAAVNKADELAAGGDFRSAVRYLYLSTVLWLHERKLLRYDRALTNHEVLRTIPQDNPLHDHLRPVVQTFDRVWYGHHALDETAFEQFRRQVASLREGRP